MWWKQELDFQWPQPPAELPWGHNRLFFECLHFAGGLGMSPVCGHEGPDVARGLVRRGSKQVTHCSLKPKCVQERNFSRRTVGSGSGITHSMSFLGRCLQHFEDLLNINSVEMTQTASGEAVTSLKCVCETFAFDLRVAVLDVLVLSSKICIPFCLLDELRLPANWKLGAEMKIIMNRDGNQSAPRWHPAIYMARSCLQERGDRELLAGSMLWVKYILAWRERAEGTKLCFRKVDYTRW